MSVKILSQAKSLRSSVVDLSRALRAAIARLEALGLSPETVKICKESIDDADRVLEKTALMNSCSTKRRKGG